MRVIAVAVLAITMLFWGLASQSAPHTPQQADATINPAEMHKTIDMNKLPDLESAALF